jgi:hypothetical protein
VVRIRTEKSLTHNAAYVPYGISFVASPEEGKADQGEAEPDENGHKAGQGRVPVTVAARLFFRAREQIKHLRLLVFRKRQVTASEGSSKEKKAQEPLVSRMIESIHKFLHFLKFAIVTLNANKNQL